MNKHAAVQLFRILKIPPAVAVHWSNRSPQHEKTRLRLVQGCLCAPSSTIGYSRCYSTAPGALPDVVTLKYINGLPNITVLLPSRNERCQFALRPISHNVGDFLQMLRSEDRGIDRAIISSQDGIRISAACSIEHLMDQNFILTINDKDYLVKAPTREKITAEELTRLGDVQILVAQLYEALNVGEHQLKRQRELQEALENLNAQISPLEQIKIDLDAKSVRRTNVLTWCGLGFMSIQFGILARLTWWEYSWDIMEPVTYFVTYGTAMAGYAYYCITKQEYILEDVRDRQYLLAMHKKAKKHGLDLLQYNSLRRQIVEIESDLRRLRDPLHLHVPAEPKKVYPDDTNAHDAPSSVIESGTADRLKQVVKGLKEKLTRK